MTFDKLSAYLVKQGILKDGVIENLVTLGIRPEDWPDSYQKSLLIDFVKAKDSENFQWAQWKAIKALSVEKLDEIIGEFFMPADPQVVQTEYQKLLAVAKREDLLVKMSRDPTRTDELIRSYQESKVLASDFTNFSDEIDAYFEEEKRIISEGKALVALPKWPLLSEKIGGFNPGRFGILMADSGFGKSTAASQFAIDASESMKVLYFNMEMNNHDFTKKLVAASNEAPFWLMNKPDWNGTVAAKARAKRRKLFYSKGRALSLFEIQSACRFFKKEHDVEIVIVDYDQKLVLEGKDEEWRELQKAAVTLESTAKELDVHLLLLAQTNFEGGLSGSKRIAFPASYVLHFSRDEENGAHIRATKNRFGPKNACLKVEYKPESSTVKELESIVWTGPKKYSSRK